MLQRTRYSVMLSAVAIAVVVSGMAVPGTAQESLQLLSPAKQDLVSAKLLIPMNDKSAVTLEREPVVFTWPLSADEKIEPAPQVHRSKSRSYRLRVSAAELAAGVMLPTESPGAYVHLSPLADVDTAQLYAIDPMNLEISPHGGKALDVGAGMELLVDAEELQAAGAPFPAGTSAFKVRPELGSGELKLRAPQLRVDDEVGYMIQVLERDSTVVLDLGTDQVTYLTGQLLAAEAVLLGGKNLRIEQISGHLRSPAGDIVKLEMERTDTGSYRARLPLHSKIAAAQGLWEIEVRISAKAGELQVRRDVRTAFGYAVPTARLTGLVSVPKAANGLMASLGVDVAGAGRYEVRGVLLGTDSNGALQPLAMMHSAAWLEPGAGELKLVVDREVLESSALAAPYEVHDLRLLDQGRMGLLHHQARGFIIE